MNAICVTVSYNSRHCRQNEQSQYHSQHMLLAFDSAIYKLILAIKLYRNSTSTKEKCMQKLSYKSNLGPLGSNCNNNSNSIIVMVIECNSSNSYKAIVIVII